MKPIAGAIVLLGLLTTSGTAFERTKKVAPKKSVKAAKGTVVKSKSIPEYLKYPVLGTWTLRPGGKTEDPSIRLVFRDDASFTWIGPNFRSDGKYWYKPGKATLDYRVVDGKTYKPGVIRMSLVIDEVQKGFVVDGRIYGLKGEPTLVIPEVPPATEPPPPSY